MKSRVLLVKVYLYLMFIIVKNQNSCTLSYHPSVRVNAYS